MSRMAAGRPPGVRARHPADHPPLFMADAADPVCRLHRDLSPDGVPDGGHLGPVRPVHRAAPACRGRYRAGARRVRTGSGCASHGRTRLLPPHAAGAGPRPAGAGDGGPLPPHPHRAGQRSHPAAPARCAGRARTGARAPGASLVVGRRGRDRVGRAQWRPSCAGAAQSGCACRSARPFASRSKRRAGSSDPDPDRHFGRRRHGNGPCGGLCRYRRSDRRRRVLARPGTRPLRCCPLQGRALHRRQRLDCVGGRDRRLPAERHPSRLRRSGAGRGQACVLRDSAGARAGRSPADARCRPARRPPAAGRPAHALARRLSSTSRRSRLRASTDAC